MKTWIHFVNPFLVAGLSSFKKAVKISTYTDGALFARKADAFYGPIYTAYHPFHVALLAKYNDWKQQGGVQKGATLNIDQLLHLLSPTKINDWDYAIMGVYKKQTPAYTAIFPNGHKPFYRGDKLSRINAVTQLKKSLTGIASLATTLTDVTNFEAQLIAANTTQVGTKTTTETYSADVEKVITDAMVEMVGILGQCIAHFKEDATQADPIFDLDTIRNHQQVVFNTTLHGNEHETLVEHTFAATDSIEVKADGTTDIGVYLAANNGDGPTGYTVITVHAGNDITIDISQFTNDTTNKFLSVVNLSPLTDGHVKVDIS